MRKEKHRQTLWKGDAGAMASIAHRVTYQDMVDAVARGLTRAARGEGRTDLFRRGMSLASLSDLARLLCACGLWELDGECGHAAHGADAPVAGSDGL
jgi:hypothetical protein